MAAAVVVNGSAVYPAVYSTVHHEPVSTQYHSQDEWGQYAYGYSGGPSAKHEQRTADGVTRGGYSYVDANGVVQSVSYVSDPANGFRAAGTNFPASTAPVIPVHPWSVPAVSAAAVAEPSPAVLPTVVDARHLAVVPAPLYSTAKLTQPLTPADTASLHYPEHAVIIAGRKKRSVGLYSHPLLSGYVPPTHVVTVKHAELAAAPEPVVHHVAGPTAYVAPAPVATSYTNVVRHLPAPPVLAYTAAVPSPVVKHYGAVVVPAVSTQYHSQDEHGQYTYGYADGASAKTETRYADGVTKGSYSYVDDNGALQAVHYTAGADGFKAAGTNIPVHHV